MVAVWAHRLEAVSFPHGHSKDNPPNAGSRSLQLSMNGQPGDRGMLPSMAINPGGSGHFPAAFASPTSLHQSLFCRLERGWLPGSFSPRPQSRTGGHCPGPGSGKAHTAQPPPHWGANQALAKCFEQGRGLTSTITLRRMWSLPMGTLLSA